MSFKFLFNTFHSVLYLVSVCIPYPHYTASFVGDPSRVWTKCLAYSWDFNKYLLSLIVACEDRLKKVDTHNLETRCQGEMMALFTYFKDVEI